MRKSRFELQRSHGIRWIHSLSLELVKLLQCCLKVWNESRIEPDHAGKPPSCCGIRTHRFACEIENRLNLLDVRSSAVGAYHEAKIVDLFLADVHLGALHCEARFDQSVKHTTNVDHVLCHVTRRGDDEVVDECKGLCINENDAEDLIRSMPMLKCK